MTLYEECLELSLDWDSTEDIIHGCVDHVSKAKDAEIERLKHALEESVKLQSHYAMLLNMWDQGERLQFDSAQAWLDRLAFIQRAREATR